MSTRRWTPLLLASFVGLVACGGGGDQQNQTNERETEAPGQVEDTAAVHAEESGQAVDLSLSPKNQSGVSGRARLHQHGDSLHVSLRLTGLDPGASYPAHVHHGTCQTGGGVAVGLNAVSGRDSTGTSSTTFLASTVSPDSAYFLQAHLPEGTPAACGDVPTGAFGSSGGM